MNILEKEELAQAVTFNPDKTKPVYNWFYYKEAFSRNFVIHALKEYSKEPSLVFDPFCGVGTTLLACKEKGISSAGIDTSPLAVFVSRVKTEDYSKEDLNTILKEIDCLKKSKFEKNAWEWRFELFPPQRAFPKPVFQELLFLRKKIGEIKEEKTRNFLLLALLSIIPETSFLIKDGGVLRICRRKKPAPASIFFKKSIEMIEGIKKAKLIGPKPVVCKGDARRIDLDNETASCIITSPPYLNNVDYTKVYGLELSLLGVTESETKRIRRESLNSFIKKESRVIEENEIIELTRKNSVGEQIPSVAFSYFQDMKQSIQEMHRILEKNGMAFLVVSNAVFPNCQVFVDSALAEIGELIGFSSQIWVCGKEKPRISGIRERTEVRESTVVLKKEK